MAVGLAVATVVPSCTLMEKAHQAENDEFEEAVEGRDHDDSEETCDWDCPACGMG